MMNKENQYRYSTIYVVIVFCLTFSATLVIFGLIISSCYRPAVIETRRYSIFEDACENAAWNIRRLGCLDSDGRSMSVSRYGELFEDICEKSLGNGMAFPDPICVAGAMTCDEVSRCQIWWWKKGRW